MESDYRDRIKSYYNRFAWAYDLGEFFRRGTRSAVVDASGCTNGDRVLEICSGTCELALAFTRQNIQTVAVDLAHDMLRFGSRKSKNEELGLVQADAFKLPFPDRSFKAVVISLALHHMPEAVQITVLKEMARCAADRVITLEWHAPERQIFRILKGSLIRAMDVSEHLWDWMKQDFPSTCSDAGLIIESRQLHTAGFHRLTVCKPSRGDCFQE